MNRYHHIGIPTSEPRPGERYVDGYGMFVSGYETSEFGVEWMRFETDSPLPKLVQSIPHVAFEVESLDAALVGREVLVAPNSPVPGVRVAFIIEDGAPIEFLEFESASGPDEGEAST